MDTTCDYYPPGRNPPPPPPPSFKWAGTVLLGGFALLLALSVGGAYLLLRIVPHQPSATTSPSAKAPAANDPWPECAAVRKWLQEHTGDPKSVEIIEWRERKNKSPAHIEGSPVVFVKYRLRNEQGGFQVETRIFGFENGKIKHTLDTNNRLLPGEVLK